VDRKTPFPPFTFEKCTLTGRRVVTDLSRGKLSVQDQEGWKELCAQAAIEQDPKRLLELVQEINRMLAEKQNRLNNQQTIGIEHLSPRR